MRLIFVSVLLAAALTAACSTPVPPTLTRVPIVAIDKSTPIYVHAQEQRRRIEESLRSSDLNVVDRPVPNGYTLKVLVGESRASHECGTVNNVSYTLIGGTANLAGTPILQIKARGDTGTCEPNVFDQMSVLLASMAS